MDTPGTQSTLAPVNCETLWLLFAQNDIDYHQSDHETLDLCLSVSVSVSLSLSLCPSVCLFLSLSLSHLTFSVLFNYMLSGDKCYV